MNIFFIVRHMMLNCIVRIHYTAVFASAVYRNYSTNIDLWKLKHTMNAFSRRFIGELINLQWAASRWEGSILLFKTFFSVTSLGMPGRVNKYMSWKSIMFACGLVGLYRLFIVDFVRDLLKINVWIFFRLLSAFNALDVEVEIWIWVWNYEFFWRA